MMTRQSPPPPWAILKPRFVVMVDALGPTEVARRMYGDSGASGVQIGLRSVYNWIHGVHVPELTSRILMFRVLESYENRKIGTSGGGDD